MRVRHRPRAKRARALFWIAVVLALAPWSWLLASPALAVDAQSQENPYVAPPSDGDGFVLFRLLENLPIWGQAAVVSAVASLIIFLVLDIARSWWQHGQFGIRRKH